MRPRASVVGRRAGALLAASSAVLHGISLGHAANVMAMGVMVAMIAGCLYCARDLWRHGTQRGWVLVASMNFAMIAIHLPMPPEHHHGTGLASALPTHDSTVMTALAAVEVTVAAVVLYHRTRALRPDPARADVNAPHTARLRGICVCSAATAAEVTRRQAVRSGWPAGRVRRGIARRPW